MGRTTFGYSREKFSHGSRAVACSLYIAAQFLSAETCSPMGCGICHSIKRASNRRGGKSRESHTLGQTGKAPRPLAASTSTPKPRGKRFVKDNFSPKRSQLHLTQRTIQLSGWISSSNLRNSFRITSSDILVGNALSTSTLPFSTVSRNVTTSI